MADTEHPGSCGKPVEARDSFGRKVDVLFPVRFNLLRVGGVARYYQSILAHLDRRHVRAFDLSLQERRQIQGLLRPTLWRRFSRRLIALKDTVLLAHRLAQKSFDLVHVNPSMSWSAVRRDMRFARKAHRFGLPIVVTFHGWNKTYESHLERTRKPEKLREVFGEAGAILVLASEFREKLVEWGFDEQKIIVATTMVEDSLVDGLDIEAKLSNIGVSKPINVLFLSRIIKAKGIYEAMETHRLLKGTYSSVRLIIAGDGSALKAAQRYVAKKGLEDVTFLGYVSGDSKRKVLAQADVYLLPTYGEGMPVSVLEAMAFGLPIVTRAVGGLKDFFENGKMGFITQSSDPAIFAQMSEKLITKPKLRERIGRYNYEYAMEHFLASKVVRRIETIYQDVISNTAKRC